MRANQMEIDRQALSKATQDLIKSYPWVSNREENFQAAMAIATVLTMKFSNHLLQKGKSVILPSIDYGGKVIASSDKTVEVYFGEKTGTKTVPKTQLIHFGAFSAATERIGQSRSSAHLLAEMRNELEKRIN